METLCRQRGQDVVVQKFISLSRVFVSLQGSMSVEVGGLGPYSDRLSAAVTYSLFMSITTTVARHHGIYLYNLKSSIEQ